MINILKSILIVVGGGISLSLSPVLLIQEIFKK
jgi:hypothetical protein